MRWLGARFRRLFSTLAHDPPGERFVRHYERSRRERAEHPIRKATFLTAGSLFVLAGLAMVVLPGPGLLFTLTGLVVLASRARRVARLLDRGEVALRSMLPERFRR